MKSLLKSLLSISLILIAITACQTSRSNQTPDIPDFKLIIESTDTGIRLQSVEGSAWTELTVNEPTFTKQSINPFGMTDASENQTNNDRNLANYLITITKSETGITLKGIEGTAWTDLEFSLNTNQRQAINQYGMTSLN